MLIRFTKMQGAGNDFVVLDETQGRLGLTAAQYRFLADRHFGVGADQILTVRPSPADGVDFEYVIHNADGGEVEQCGNGSRCFARFVYDKGLTDKTTIRVQTLSGVIAPQLTPDGRVTVDMGLPVLDAPRVPFDASGLAGLRRIAQGTSLLVFNSVVLDPLPSVARPNVVTWLGRDWRLGNGLKRVVQQIQVMSRLGLTPMQGRVAPNALQIAQRRWGESEISHAMPTCVL